MHRKIGTPVVALVLFAALSAVSFAQTSNSGGVDPTAEGIGSTSSTHNPRPSSPLSCERRCSTLSEPSNSMLASLCK